MLTASLEKAFQPAQTSHNITHKPKPHDIIYLYITSSTQTPIVPPPKPNRHIKIT